MLGYTRRRDSRRHAVGKTEHPLVRYLIRMRSTQDREQLEELPFRVDPHMLEDLGLNLYSSLPRVLVEFIANAYDADARQATVSMDFNLISHLRQEMREAWQERQADAETDADLERLEEGLLPEEATISIQDNGHGMSLRELRDKFLVAGRRRRIDGGDTSPDGRVLMGRKGVGKLAGFGVARLIQVVSKVPGDENAHSIHLDFDSIMGLPDSSEIRVPTFRLNGDGGLGKQGTRVTFSRLVHESVKSRENTIRRSIGDHFFLIDPSDFSMSLNGAPVEPNTRALAYAWPERENLGVHDLVDHSVAIPETGEDVEFQYRLRFVEDRAALRASERGVRVYAHKRLAAAPSLLHADTNMHGFRMTDYLDGVVYADFIDDHRRDYIATDRQGLRWETPLLQPVHDFLGGEIKEACKNYQAVRDAEKKKEVEEDVYTTELIDSAQLSSRERRLAIAVCSRLASFHREGVKTEAYRDHAKLLVGAIGKGEIFSAISKIGEQDHPRLHALAVEVTKLTHAEIDQTLGVVKSRIVAIQTLKRIVESVDFRNSNDEDALHSLFKANPWLIDPTYFEFLTSNLSNQSLFARLEQELGIASGVPPDYDKSSQDEAEPMKKNLRPDLVFLLANYSLRRIVIVELKAPNTPLLHKHLLQLEDYMAHTERFLGNLDRTNVTVEGCLIGSIHASSQAREVERLRRYVRQRGTSARWKVFDLLDLLEQTCSAHQEILGIHEETEGDGD